MAIKASKKKTSLRLGLYGGTFDPIHLGHLLLARDALEQAHLDAVIFIPAKQSPHKDRGPLASEKQRLSMLKAAGKEEPRFWISRCELDRPTPSYTYDTVIEIGEAFPKAKLFWLLGADQFETLEKWHRASELRQIVTFLKLTRRLEKEVPLPTDLLSLPRPREIDISATEIRYRVKKNLPIHFLVPPSVGRYIKRQRLYLS